MFADYQAQVLEEYRKRLVMGQLSLRLTVPTAAKLKAECLAVCEEKYQKKDEQLLRLFFGVREGQAGYLQAIKICEADKFKPLINFLRKATAATDEKNIELLAWLIGFEPRPYQIGFVAVASNHNDLFPAADNNTDEQPTPPAQALQPDEETSSVTGKGKVADYKYDTDDTDALNQPVLFEPDAVYEVPAIATNRRKKRIIAIGTVLLTAIGVCIYLLWGYRFTSVGNHKLMSGSSTPCMYWAETHYQQTNCNQKHGHTPVIALDTAQLAHFKRITEPDTITPASIRKIWYFKNKGQLELYTSGGSHPVYRNRRLLPVTAHIYKKYIAPK
ncbi:hypothetical protein [Mucilaginibacter sp.]